MPRKKQTNNEKRREAYAKRTPEQIEGVKEYKKKYNADYYAKNAEKINEKSMKNYKNLSAEKKAEIIRKQKERLERLTREEKDRLNKKNRERRARKKQLQQSVESSTILTSQNTDESEPSVYEKSEKILGTFDFIPSNNKELHANPTQDPDKIANNTSVTNWCGTFSHPSSPSIDVEPDENLTPMDRELIRKKQRSENLTEEQIAKKRERDRIYQQKVRAKRKLLKQTLDSIPLDNHPATEQNLFLLNNNNNHTNQDEFANIDVDAEQANLDQEIAIPEALLPFLQNTSMEDEELEKIIDSFLDSQSANNPNENNNNMTKDALMQKFAKEKEKKLAENKKYRSKMTSEQKEKRRQSTAKWRAKLNPARKLEIKEQKAAWRKKRLETDDQEEKQKRKERENENCRKQRAKQKTLKQVSSSGSDVNDSFIETSQSITETDENMGQHLFLPDFASQELQSESDQIQTIPEELLPLLQDDFIEEQQSDKAVTFHDASSSPSISSWCSKFSPNNSQSIIDSLNLPAEPSNDVDQDNITDNNNHSPRF